MNKKNPKVSIIVILFIGVFALFIFGKVGALAPLQNIVQFVFSPLQKALHSAISVPFAGSSQTQQLQKENRLLLESLVNQKNLQKENAALKDQFQSTIQSSYKLLPSDVVGSPGFIPGISLPQYFILNRGSGEGVVVGQAVIYKDILVGVIESVSSSLSRVLLVTNNNSSFTAKTIAPDIQTATESAVGVIKGQGIDEILFDNVLVAQRLKTGDIVVTKGTINSSGKGVPPDIIIGKVISVDKKPSALFQSAQVESPLDFTKLEKVFVVLGIQQ